MATPVLRERSFDAAFHRLQDRRREESQPSWLGRLAEGALDRFIELDLPTTADEEWKYTNLAPIRQSNFVPAIEPIPVAALPDSHDINALTYAEATTTQLVFVNGYYSAGLSRGSGFPDGVVATDLAEALRDPRHADTLREHLARYADYQRHSLTALNTAFVASGAFILIPAGTRVEAPIHLLFISTGSARDTGNLPTYSPRSLVIAGPSSAATIIESYWGSDDSAYWNNAVFESSVSPGAQLDVYRVQREGGAAFHTAATSARLSRDARFGSTAINLGGRIARHDIAINMDEPGAECRLDGVYITGDGQHTDTHSTIDHIAPCCASSELYKGILDGKSRAVFNGKVFVRPGAQKTDARQTNKNLLLSNDAHVDTKPQLEIFADDVKCAHGATVGQLDEEELFYLSSRGLHPGTARNLLTYGFAEEVISRVGIESIRRQLDEAVLNRLHARLEA